MKRKIFLFFMFYYKTFIECSCASWFSTETRVKERCIYEHIWDYESIYNFQLLVTCEKNK